MSDVFSPGDRVKVPFLGAFTVIKTTYSAQGLPSVICLSDRLGQYSAYRPEALTRIKSATPPASAPTPAPATPRPVRRGR